MTIQEMARKGGKASANKRLGGKTQSEVSEIMRNIRYSKKDYDRFDKIAKSSVESLKKIT